MSETAKYRGLTVPYCQGSVVDIGAGGDPVVPWAITFDLPHVEFEKYNARPPVIRPNLEGHCSDLPFKDGSIGTAYSSHVLEDFKHWHGVLSEWARVVQPGGHVVIVIPDRELWLQAVANGQPPNCAHQHEGKEGELTPYFPGWEIIRDSRTNLFPGDYSILFIARKPL